MKFDFLVIDPYDNENDSDVEEEEIENTDEVAEMETIGNEAEEITTQMSSIASRVSKRQRISKQN